MSESGGSASSGGLDSLLSRDVLLVALAILALIVAAFAVPPIDASGGGAGNETGEDGGEEPADGRQTPAQTPGQRTPGGQPDGKPGDDPGDGGGDGDDVARVEANATGSGDGPSLDAGGTAPHPECFVVVWDRLVPGKNATVFRWHDGDFVADRPVWFEDRRLGRTDEDGRIDGRVPYTRQLELTAGVDDVDACHLLPLDVETDYDEWRQQHGSPRIVVDTDQLQALEPANGNVTSSLPVHGNTTLAVEGDPFPGETVRLNATVDGIPMRSATVTVDGERVGETDDGGFYDLRIPDDGTEDLAVEVARGDFANATAIDVLLLSVALRPEGLLALPGSQTTAVTTLADRPASGVTIAVDGRTLGTTDDRGRATLDLPADPGATVRASGYDQSASAPVWPLYVPTALVALLGIGLIAGSLAYATRHGSAGTTKRVLAVWVGAAVLVGAAIVGGRHGVALVLGGGAVIGVLLATVVYRATVRGWLAAAGGLVVAAIRAVKRLALGLADWLGWLADRSLAALRAVVAKLAGLPRSLRGLLAVGWTWLAGVPGRLGDAARRSHAAVAARARAIGAVLSTPRGIAALLASIGLIAGAYHVSDEQGALAAAGALLVFWSVVALVRRRDPASAGTSEARSTGRTGGATGAGASSTERSHLSLEALWRTFARWVVPGGWRRRTPGEVARAAVARGFPEEPVVRLTEAFREVEYGERPESPDRLDRAQSAFEDLQAAKGDEEGRDG